MFVVNQNNVKDILVSRNETVGVDRYFTDLIYAILLVSEKYVIWQYGVDNQMSERVFAYELYHQWRLLENQNDYCDVLLNGEIQKSKSILRRDGAGNVYPDLILHQEQNSLNRQLIACEIKTEKAIIDLYGNLTQDFSKLNSYVEHLNFERAVFLQVMDAFDTFNKFVKPFLMRQKALITHPDKIYIAIKSGKEVRFGNILELVRGAQGMGRV